MVENGVEIDKSSDGNDGETALIEAARTGMTESVRVLLDHKANPNAKDK